MRNQQTMVDTLSKQRISRTLKVTNNEKKAEDFFNKELGCHIFLVGPGMTIQGTEMIPGAP